MTARMDANDKFKKLNKDAANIKLEDKKPMMICDRLSKLYNTGTEAKQKKNLDEAYVYFKRWIFCAEWLSKQRLDQPTIQKFFPNTKIRQVKNLLQEVSKNIQLEIEIQNSRTYQRKNKDFRIDDEDIALLLPDIPNEEPQPKENDEITCTELFKILNQNIKASDKRLLVIDVRSKIDYNLTRISFQDNMINIPEENIESNKAASQYSILLLDDKDAMNRFNRRSGRYSDIVVLLDWYSSVNTMKSNSPIAILRKCLKELDSRTEYKRMSVLKGGFAEWMNTYPTYVTNPSIRKPFVKNVPPSDVAIKVSNDSLPSIPSNENLKPLPTTPTLSNSYLTDIKSLPTSDIQAMDTSSDTLDKLDYDSIPSLENYTPSPVLSKTHPVGVPVKPFSASNSQISVKTNSNLPLQPLYADLPKPMDIPKASVPSASLVVNGYFPQTTYSPEISNSGNDRHLLRQNNITLEAKVSVEKLPEKPHVDRSKKPQNLTGRKTSTSSLTEEHQKQLKYQESIDHYMNKWAQGSLDNWSKEQFDVMRKQEPEVAMEVEKMTKFLSKDVAPRKLYPPLPDVSSMSLGTKPRVPRPPKPDLSEEKENLPREAAREVPRLERLKAEKPLMPPPPPIQKMEVNDGEDEDEEEQIHKEPLKSENLSTNSGLKRSYSSPNLVQVKKLKDMSHQKVEKKQVPEVDRSLKPRVVLENNNYRRHMKIITFKDREERMEPVYASSGGSHPGITGLKNLGNSCYMNSIIQCLSNTVYLANYFNDNLYINHLNKNSDKGVQGYVAEEVAQVIKALWRGLYKSISPRDLKVVVGQYKLQFESYDQQDSHEFLMFLLDWMHNDLKQKSKISYDRPLTTAEKEWEKSMDGQSSIISKLFFGQLRSTIECLECRKNSMTYETFNSLTMSLPVSNRCTLDDCVRKFVSGQKVSGWKCPNCKVPREGVKKFDIAKLPHIIVIHLNRFGDTGGWLEKKNTAVEFPLSDFNLRPYLIQDGEHQLNNQQSSLYNLYAMSNHYGTMDGGHYTAYCKSSGQNKWYKYDDHTVTEVPQNQIKNQSNSAYLLFYTSASAEPYLNS